MATRISTAAPGTPLQPAIQRRLESALDADLSAVGELAAAQLDPEPDIHASAGYRRQLARTLTARAVADAARRAAA